MDLVARFMTYAADFEKTLVDDDWSRLTGYFADDAVYRVESDQMGCELQGPQAIFAGIKKSLDGFDRRFAGREIALTEGPDVEGDTLRVSWTVTYQMAGTRPFVLRGRSLSELRDDKISLLVDSYDERVAGELKAWMDETGVALDPSYV